MVPSRSLSCRHHGLRHCLLEIDPEHVSMHALSIHRLPTIQHDSLFSNQLCIDPKAFPTSSSDPLQEFAKIVSVSDKVDGLPVLGGKDFLFVNGCYKRHEWFVPQNVAIIVTNQITFVWWDFERRDWIDPDIGRSCSSQ